MKTITFDFKKSVSLKTIATVLSNAMPKNNRRMVTSYGNDLPNNDNAVCKIKTYLSNRDTSLSPILIYLGNNLKVWFDKTTLLNDGQSNENFFPTEEEILTICSVFISKGYEIALFDNLEKDFLDKFDFSACAEYQLIKLAFTSTLNVSLLDVNYSMNKEFTMCVLRTIMAQLKHDDREIVSKLCDVFNWLNTNGEINVFYQFILSIKDVRLIYSLMSCFYIIPQMITDHAVIQKHVLNHCNKKTEIFLIQGGVTESCYGVKDEQVLQWFEEGYMYFLNYIKPQVDIEPFYTDDSVENKFYNLVLACPRLWRFWRTEFIKIYGQNVFERRLNFLTNDEVRNLNMRIQFNELLNLN